MELLFYKYQGAGNDFILCDDREGGMLQQLSQPRIAALCNRHYGIGADGFIILRNHPDYDFEMVYFNSDGAPSSMCGNGGRCIVRFAADLKIQRNRFRFLAVDGPHEATLQSDGHVSLGMSDVERIYETDKGDLVLDTGSPHYLRFVPEVDKVNVVEEARAIRYSPPFDQHGINVNFVTDRGHQIEIATYERGVEAETLACGTGVTAAAIGVMQRRDFPRGQTFIVGVKAKGGMLSVSGKLSEEGHYTNLHLTGPAEYVFRGAIQI